MDEKVLSIIRDLTNSKDYEHCCGSYISEVLKIPKNSINMALNRLHKKGELVKINSKPLLFVAKDILEKNASLKITQNEFDSIEAMIRVIDKETLLDFEKLIGYNESLSDLVDSLKATLSYPPNGLPVLLNGPTGTGKSMLARLAYEYCVNHHLIKPQGRFVQVNCSEYANNPELLSANLFGYKRGSFTGAEKDNMGLLHYADGGLLFLDEVHCLKAECQEKLFLYMD